MFPEELSPVGYFLETRGEWHYIDLSPPTIPVAIFHSFDGREDKIKNWGFSHPTNHLDISEIDLISIQDLPYKNTLLSSIATYMLESKCLFMIWDSWEVMDHITAFSILNIVHNFCESKGISPNRFILSDSSISSQILNQYYEVYSREERVNFVSFNAFEYRVSDYYKDKEIKTDGFRNKHFLCMNRIPKFHRVDVMAFLLKFGILGLSHASFNPSINGLFNFEDRCLSDLHLHPEDYQKLKSISPIILDDRDLENNENHCYGPYRPGNIDFFVSDSHIQIVTESIVDGDFVFLTEKTFKCFHFKQPFILIGNSGSLKELRKSGYKTFGPWIDERYDEIEDYEERMKAIFKEIKRLSRLPLPILVEIRSSMMSILEHNFTFSSYEEVVYRSHQRYNRVISEIVNAQSK